MNIVFLDIDGVLQPYDSENRFYSDKRTIGKLSNKFGIDYSKHSFYDVTAVYYDWDSQAVSRLKYILDKTNSKIIISSDWRNNNDPNKMKDLLTIQKLDSYYFCDNVILDKVNSLAYTRALEIQDSLNRYNIDNYVVLDDMKELREYFPDNIVVTNNIISVSNMNESIKILQRKK